MVTTWTARATALLALVAWGLKSFAIVAAGGVGKSSLEKPLWVIGIVLEVIACAVVGAIVAGLRERGPAARLGGAVIGIAVGAGLVAVCTLASRDATPKSWGWFRNDSGQLVGALLIFVIAFIVHDSRRRGLRRAKEKELVAAREREARAAHEVEADEPQQES